MHEANEPPTSTARTTRLTSAEDQSHRAMRSHGPSEEKGWPPPANRWQRSASTRFEYCVFLATVKPKILADENGQI